METIDLVCPVRVGPAASSNTRPIRAVTIRNDDVPDGEFSATLLAIAGHDLRQPLQIITNVHDVLAPTLANQKQREELMRAGEATAQLASMLGQLVEALQLREQPGQNLHLPVPLGPVLNTMQAEFAEAARLKGITFSVTTTEEIALSHPVLLTSMLRNLIRNAIDYTPPSGDVSVTAHRRGARLRIEVRDTGVGIRAGARSRIFDAFERADAGRTDGLGLGLFIVKRAADLLRHRVGVHSAEGCGSRFTVTTGAAMHRSKPVCLDVTSD